MESSAASWLFVSNTGHSKSLNNLKNDVKIQKENEVCICDFVALKVDCD